ncbi:MAG: TolC family protein [Candidatus Omnitrophota bacterium]
MGRLFLFICVLLCVLLVSSGELSAETSPYLLADLSYEVMQGHADVILAINEKVDYIYSQFEDPYRIVIDLVGVIYCELEQKIEFQEGPVESVAIVENSNAPRPEGLDKYFYAVDYLIIQLRQGYPYNVFSSNDGKVIIAQVKTETPGAQTSAKEETQALPSLNKRDVLTMPARDQAQIIHKEKPAILEDLEYEVNPNSSIVSIISSKDLQTTIYEQYDPYRITIVPSCDVYCELQEIIEPIDGLIHSISINRDISDKELENLDEFFYPVKDITIEPVIQIPFTVHNAESGAIIIVRLEKPKASEEKKLELVMEVPQKSQELETPETKAPELLQAGLTTDDKEKIVQQITDRLHEKQQQLFDSKEEQEHRDRLIREARDKAMAIREVEKIGMEQLEDLMVRGEGTIKLGYCQDMALSYSEDAKVAQEEIKLSSMKLKENFRALFPNVKLKGSKTTGDVLGVDFIEKLYGVEAEYPIYQGTRLWSAYQQSKVNLNLSKARYDKAVNDVDYKAADAYYSSVTATMNLRLQKELLKKAEEILAMAEKRRSTGLSTDLELFNVKSQYNQVQFQLASAERDLALAKFKLEQAMGFDIAKQRIGTEEIETELKFEIVSIDLNKCLELAQDYHPDILVNELLVESNEYDEKIAKSKDDFKVDLTGFYGRSGSHYETEPDKMDKDWNVGVKVSKPFWGNTASYSFTREETKRKVGQTDRQGTIVNSGEFSILDAMDVGSGMQEARIKRHKAQNELLETRRQVNMDVKEAYYNCQEAIIQVKNALEKVRYQKEALKTARMQAQLNEALQSQVIEAEIKLADERSQHIKALSDYSFSLVKLNKAVGIKDYFNMESK